MSKTTPATLFLARAGTPFTLHTYDCDASVDRIGMAVIEAAALSEPLVYVNGGRRGLQVRLSPVDAQAVLGAVSASVVA